MKTQRVIRILTLSLLLSGWSTVNAQDARLEVPGDHFSLEGALELFKKSGSPEAFEKMLNSPETKVNNLDLNGDGDIDYIRVIDRNEGNVHAFILQAVVSTNEIQDVAVIELEKLANGKAVLQITGDADIYGIETIIEPTEEVRINAGTSTRQTVVNVWAWPSVQYIYSPYYYGWISPWSWSYRPIWWSPWRPVNYYTYYSRWEPYRPYYSVCYTHRIYYAQPIYRPYRSTSVIVYNRHHSQISNYRSSHQYSDRNRDRYNSSRYGSSSSSNSTSNRNERSGYDRNNSATSAASWRNQNDYNRNGNSSHNNQSTSGNRNVGSNTSFSDDRGNSVRSAWRQNPENKKSFGDVNSRSQQPNQSLYNNNNNNRTSSGFERNGKNSQLQMTERKQSFGSQNTGAHQREVRSSFDARGSQQRSQVQSERIRSSSGSADMHRPGSNNGGNKSVGQKRGRD